jgi:hypothetical protein
MNAALAKPIPRVLVYSSQGLDRDQTLTASPRSFTWVGRATIHHIDVERLDCCVAQ